MAARALPVTTSDSQAVGGASCALEVMISTSSPLASSETSGAILPLILAADRVIADVGVHRVGEVDRRRLARQRDQLALRGEAEHLVVEQLELGVLEEFLRVGAFGEQRDGAAQPRIGVRFARQHLGRRADIVLVEGVRRDAELGDLVHVDGADLQLDALLAGTDHRGVDRAIVVLLRRRDVVLEAARHHRPGGVDDAERLVALRHLAHHDAEPEDVGQLLEADRLALHLAPHRIGAFAPIEHGRHDAAVGELLGELILDLADQAVVARRERVEPRADDLVGLRVQHAEREVLQLLAHLVHAHAGGERRVDVDRLLGDALARLGRHVLQRAHVVQPVGELDQQHPHVLGDGEQELAQVLGLLGLARDEVELLELGEALDQVADVLAEQLVDLGAGRLGVLDGVVQQRGDDRRIVELEVGEDRGDLERMGEIRVAGGAQLLAMRLHGVHVGAVEQLLVGVRVVLADALDQLVLAHHRRLGAGRRLLGRLGRSHAGELELAARARLLLHARQVGRRHGHPSVPQRNALRHRAPEYHDPGQTGR